jgi:hypothetical protein
MYNVGMTKHEIRSLKIRIAALRAELNDPTCQRFPTARAHVQAELDRATAALGNEMTAAGAA